MKIKIDNRTVLEIITIVWIIISVGYLTHTPYGHRSHDFHGHIRYTTIIVNEKRFPHPYEGWETFQPPLYYLIASLIPLNNPEADSFYHIAYVRLLSALFGLITFFLIAWFLEIIKTKPFHKLLILLFLATTPKFIFVFSSYNNDSLATLASIAVFVVAYKLLFNWNKVYLPILLLAATCGLYTKPTCLVPTILMMFLSLRQVFRLKLPDKKSLFVFCTLLFSLILLFPWLYFHNYKKVQRFFPTNLENVNMQKYVPECVKVYSHKEMDLEKFKNLVGLVFRIPGIQLRKPDYSREWEKPWVYPSWEEIPPATKRYDYFSFLFITSVIGEYVFTEPHVNYFWLVLLLHLVITLLSLACIFQTQVTKLTTLVIMLASLTYILLSVNYTTVLHSADYRYIAWTWAPWTSLYSAILQTRFRWLSWLTYPLFIVTILLHLYLVFTMKGGFWK